MVYPALLPLTRTPRLPVVDWTDAPADFNGLVRSAERRNLVSACVPSRFKRSLTPHTPSCSLKHFSMHSQRQDEKTPFTKQCCNASTTPLKTAACATERYFITLSNTRANEWENHGRRDRHFFGDGRRNRVKEHHFFLRGFHDSNLMGYMALCS
jgi:hypothetical protein